ncbi:MAG: magnesium/cobalt transporter CorA [Archangium sp.]|nr:magnesium/cobalt transporter CorA [Archangium sp.]
MLRVRVYDNGRLLDGDEALLGTPGHKWIDVLQPTEEVLNKLAERFGLHKLAIEDCLHLDQRPKLEEYGNHQFLVLQGFSTPTDKWSDLEMHEVHFFLAADWIITVHEKSHHAIEQTHKRIEADPANTLGRGVDFVMYLLADALVDRNFPLLDCFNDALEDLEERIFADYPSRDMLQETFQLKRALVTVRRVLSPQRDVVGLLARRGVPQVQERTTIYFRDVFDHLVRIYEQIEAARDLVGSVVEAYLSQVANRTNDVTKQLTIFASIFMPLSFLVGFFGQNFDVLGGPVFFAIMLGTIVALPVAMVFWFRHKDWI